ncbi:MAG: YggS family pyridoxal phosphate-dependent enzyme [Lautropia sp.]|nr:YggS family pyridoxal phosphate-dependent enzyme [Lautropia sp.]
MNGTQTLAAAYEQVLARMEAASTRSGRDPASVALLAVSKTRTADEVAALAALGQHAMGENYLQEALDKQAALAQQAPPIQWHFIGPIQSNKTRRIAEHFDWVHSVESLRIARRLSDQRPSERGLLDLCLQVNVSGEASKSGCDPTQAMALAVEIAQLPNLRLRGLMAIPEPTDDEAIQRKRFESLRALFEQIRAALSSTSAPAPSQPTTEDATASADMASSATQQASHSEQASQHQPDKPATTGHMDASVNQHTSPATHFDTLSMGMSDDLEAAIAAGSTMVRVGTALFGPRPRKQTGPTAENSQSVLLTPQGTDVTA